MYVSIRDDMVAMTGFDSVSEGLRHYGLDAVEVAVDRQRRIRPIEATDGDERLNIGDDAGVARLEKQLADSGARISAFILATDLNAADMDAEAAWIARVTEVADRLGVTAIRIDAIIRGERELPHEERVALTAKGLERVMAATERSKAAYGIENHGLQGNDPTFLEALFARVDTPRLGMTLDTGNFYWAGNPLDDVYQIIDRLAPRAVHTHVKNIRYPEEMRQSRRPLGYEYERYVCPIPEGDIDHARVVASLRRAGYQGDLCIEDESLGRYDRETQRAHMKAAADYLRSLAAG